MADLEFDEMIARTCEAYVSCDMVVDSGSVSVHSTCTAGNRLREINVNSDFTLEFIRGKSFAFSFKQELPPRGSGSSFSIHGTTENVNIAFSNGRVRRDLTFREAIAATTGISFGLTHLLLSLIAPELSGISSFAELVNGSRSKECTRQDLVAFLSAENTDNQLWTATVRVSDFGLIRYSSKSSSLAQDDNTLLAAGALRSYDQLNHEEVFCFNPRFA